MRPALASGAMAVAVVVAVLLAADAAGEEMAAPALILERTVPFQGLHVEQLKKLDKARLSRRNGVKEIYLEGMPGLYYTRVELGNPPKKYSLQFDTGSDILWISCSPCNGCPTSSVLNITLQFYNPSSSSTSSRISCDDDRCSDVLETGYAICDTSDAPSNKCGYNLTYADGSATTGYYVSDTMHFNKVVGNEQAANSSSTIFFGCSNSRSGGLPTDGIIGFGKNPMSVISQLHTQGMSPKVFSHCLKGSKNGGGILILGEVVDPGLVFTPLDPSQPHYNVNLKSIAVGSKNLSINSSFFRTSNVQGTIVDSGTTLAYLADGLYDPVVNAIDAATPDFITSFVDEHDNRVFICPGRDISVFPIIKLYFEDGAAMTIGPESYLLIEGYFKSQKPSNDTSYDAFIFAFQRSKSLENFQRTTILGDLVLHDKMVVYDLEKMRIGWVNYNCSRVNTSTPVVVSGSSGCRAPSYNSIFIAIGSVVFNVGIIARWLLGRY